MAFKVMRLYSGLSGEALELSQTYRHVLDRLPRSFLASNLIELRKWPIFFEPEKEYFRTLLKQLGQFSESEFQEIFKSLLDFESRTGCDRLASEDVEELLQKILKQTQRQGAYPAWRGEVQRVFDKVQPAVEARLYGAQQEARLVVVLYGRGITIDRARLWGRFRDVGMRVPLHLNGAGDSYAFLRALFTGHADESNEAPRPTLFHLLRDVHGVSPLENWIVEAGDALHTLCEKSTPNGRQVDCATGLSYERLRSFREALSEAIFSKVLSGVQSPVELAAWTRTLHVKPGDGVSLFANDLVLGFIRDVFLAGNGTLIINNSFVEWSVVQALKRAQPRLLVVRFGVRDKMKPFSSLLLFSKPRPSDQIPVVQDPFGSFIDAELHAYYIWLRGEKGPPFRGRTLYLLLAEGVDEMIVVLPGGKKFSPQDLPPVTPPDVAATMARWMKVELPGSPGRPLAAIFS